MKNYKFRAWDNHDKKWLMGYEYPNLRGFSLIGESVLFGEWGNCFAEFIFEKNGKKAEDLKIVQFTGKKDIHNSDIYEGDINQDKGIVVWNEDSSSFCWEYPDELMPFEDEGSWCEIIGNIYEQL